MAEEKEIKKEEVKEPIPKPVEPVEPVEDLDKEAIAEILRGQSEKMENMAKDVEVAKGAAVEAKGAQEKLDKVSQVLSGETEEAKKDKIFKEFADDPEATLKKYGEGKSKAELAEIRGMLEEIKFEKADQSAMGRMSSTDPDYAIVIKNIESMTTPKERKKYGVEENRFEILYGLTKSRMAGKLVESKVSAEQIKKDAITESNKGAVSEKPGGKEVAEPTERDKRDEEIAKARHDFDSDKVARLATERLLEDSDFLKKWEID